jgi:hypothetical protein
MGVVWRGEPEESSIVMIAPARIPFPRMPETRVHDEMPVSVAS